jgi:integrase
MARRQFGNVRRLPSGRWQASYIGPDGRRYTARTDDGRSLTFDGKQAAGAYLARVHADIQRGAWRSPDAPVRKIPTFAEYAARWLDNRDLAPSTRLLYSITLRRQILPAFARLPLTVITPSDVRAWHDSLQTTTGPRQRATAYTLLRTILNTAVTDDLIPASPCRVRGAGSSKRAKPIEPASIAEVQAIADAMPERLKALVLLASWCGLRFGELTALTREDVDLKTGRVHVRRAVSRGGDGYTIKAPKSDAGRRTVAIPPHILPAIRDHLRDHVGAAPGALLFGAERDRSQPLTAATLRRPYQKAVAQAGRPDLTFHGLRHTGAVLAAATGATLAELMARLGHSSPQVAMMYQHAAADRDLATAVALSQLATGADVVPISRGRKTG